MLNRIRTLAWKEFRLWANQVGNWVVLFLLPLLFIGIMGASYSSGPAVKVTVYAANEDQGERGEEVMDALLDSPNLDIQVVESRDEADRLVGDGKRMAAIVVPAGFSDALLSDQGGRLELIVDPAMDEKAKIVDGLSQAALVKFIVDAEISRAISGAMDGILGDASTEKLNSEERGLFGDFVMAGFRAVLSKQVLKAIDDPQVRVVKVAAVGEQTEGPSPAMLAIVPGFSLMFVFFLVTHLAEAVVIEREHGTLSRLLVAPVSRSAILAGKALPYLLLAILQLVGVFLVASMAFDFWPGKPLALLAVIVCTGVAVAGLGIMIAALARTTGQAGGLTVLLILGLGAIGGVLGEGTALPVLRNISPHYWAMTGLQNVMARGFGVAANWLPCAALLAMGVVAYVVGATRFRFE